MATIIRASLVCIAAAAFAALQGCSSKLQASRDTLNFGDVFVGATETRSVNWTNVRGGESEIDRFNIRGDNAFDIDVDDDDAFERELSKGETSPDLEVTFEPEAPGAYQATLVPEMERGAAESVRLVGRGVYVVNKTPLEVSGPGLSAQEALDYGEIPINGGAGTRTLTITNPTRRVIYLKPSFRDGDEGFRIRNNIDMIELGPGDRYELETQFRPRTTGVHRDVLQLTIDDTSDTAGVVVTGKGTR